MTSGGHTAAAGLVAALDRLVAQDPGTYGDASSMELTTLT
jgi:hypothetical protein